MSTINFNEIDCKQSINKENKIINFNGSEIRVLNYLSAYDTYDLIMVTLQKAFEDGIYNPIKLNTYFNLHLIYLYTNIVFSTEDRADEVELYDILNRSGLIQVVREAIGEEELSRIEILLNKTLNELTNYNFSIRGTIVSVAEKFEGKLTEWLEIFKSVSPELHETLQSKIKNMSLEDNN